MSLCWIVELVNIAADRLGSLGTGIEYHRQTTSDLRVLKNVSTMALP